MKLAVVEGNCQKLDGGAMFGNAPRAVWSKWVEVDAQGTIELATRGLFIEFDDGLKVLFETGIGAFFEPRLRERYGVTEARHVLLESLAHIDVDQKDIDVVVLSHLHFDHAGGLLSAWQEGEPAELLFPNAHYLVSRAQWERSQHPHPRDRASYIPAIGELLAASGRLELIDRHQQSVLKGQVKLHFSDGHTPGLMLSEIVTDRGPVLFCADLIPGAAWVHVPITMGYDRFPEQLIDEKQVLLDDLHTRDGLLYFTHDKRMPLGRLTQDQKGRYGVTPEILS